MKTRQILYAEDGMVLTDGVIYGTVIYLAEGKNASDFCEITKDEYELILKTQDLPADA